eukprot:2843657-Amphidinium_carterae.1
MDAHMSVAIQTDGVGHMFNHTLMRPTTKGTARRLVSTTGATSTGSGSGAGSLTLGHCSGRIRSFVPTKSQKLRTA